jgi:hypothetical protein
MDIELRRKQVRWETPKNVAILIGAIVVASVGLTSVAGFVGFMLGQASPPIIMQFQTPLSR